MYCLGCIRVLMLCMWCEVVFFFFFKQKTAYEMRISDWSSDVCSSDLAARLHAARCSLPAGIRGTWWGTSRSGGDDPWEQRITTRNFPVWPFGDEKRRELVDGTPKACHDGLL